MQYFKTSTVSYVKKAKSGKP